MEKLDFKIEKLKTAPKKINERNYWLFETSQKLKEPIGKVGSLTKGMDEASLRSLCLSSESLSKESGMNFKKAWYWHLKETKKSLISKVLILSAISILVITGIAVASTGHVIIVSNEAGLSDQFLEAVRQPVDHGVRTMGIRARQKIINENPPR
jgi:hypothetical protein